MQCGDECALGRDAILEPGVEGPHQRAGGRMARSRAAAQELGDETIHLLVDVRRQEARARRILSDDPAENRGHVGTGKRQLGGERLEHGDADAEEVRTRVDEGVPASLFGRGIARGTVDPAALPGTLVGGRGIRRAHPKIEKVNVELSVAATVEQDVLGLDVAVDVAMPMHAVENRREAGHDDGDLPRADRPAPSQVRGEALGAHVPHHDVWRAVVEHAVVDDGHDAGMEHTSGNLDFAAHPANQIGIPRVGRPEHLDDDPLERRQALGLVHDPRPPMPIAVPIR